MGEAREPKTSLIGENSHPARVCNIEECFPCDDLNNSALARCCRWDESNGISYTTHEVDINQGAWQSSATVTTKWRDGSLQIDKDTVSGVQLSSRPS